MTISPSGLSEWLNKIESLHPSNIELGLDRIKTVAERLDLLHPNFPVITVGGTNGKGTCCSKLSNIYTEAGYKVGCYTSPHLIHFNERIMINHLPVDDDLLIRAFEQVQAACEEIQLTFFEYTTLSALLIFKQANLDLIILEVGLGGRLDATNIIDSDVAVITSIDLDHQAWLGNDRESIAREKAGIMRPSCPVFVSDPYPPRTLTDYANSINAALILTTEANLVPDIITRLQPKLPVQADMIEAALKAHQLTGRLHILSHNPTIILDVAHNPAATQRLSDFLKSRPCTGHRIGIISLLKDKDTEETLKPLLHQIDTWYACDTSGPRGAKGSQIITTLNSLNAKHTTAFDTPEAAFLSAKAIAQQEDQIIAFGSFQTVGGVLKLAS